MTPSKGMCCEKCYQNGLVFDSELNFHRRLNPPWCNNPDCPCGHQPVEGKEAKGGSFWDITYSTAPQEEQQTSWEEGYAKGQEDAFMGKIQNLKTLEITETVNVPQALRDYFKQEAKDQLITELMEWAGEENHPRIRKV